MPVDGGCAIALRRAAAKFDERTNGQLAAA
jgi:hypothetical protein